jgi:mono/diheme cytochrome c family protein
MKRTFVVGVLLVTAAAAAEPRPLTEADASAGKAAYLRECSGCHGERGDGRGSAAPFLEPQPRDFLRGRFKFRTTAWGQPPTTADVLRTIERGIPGTAMPAFAFLPEEERRRIAAYVLRVADLLDAAEPTPLPPPGPPPPATAQAIAAGKQLYADAGCGSCHGLAGTPDAQATKDLKNTDGTPTRARDLVADPFRGGEEPLDVYYRIVGGIDGTPMPAFGDAVPEAQLWTLVHYVASLRAPRPPAPLPPDPIAAGRAVAAKHGCGGCHKLDDGQGGDVGPDLRLSGRKLQPDWVRAFLHAPREAGKIYPWRVARMPDLPLTPDEVDRVVEFLGAIGKRPATAGALPDPATFPAARVEEGKNLFVLRCSQCHALGKIVETPLAAQQGPDLIHVARRVDFAWSKEWITDPRKWDPKTRMQVADITPEQVDSVRMFLWKTSIAADAARVAGRPAAR